MEYDSSKGTAVKMQIIPFPTVHGFTNASYDVMEGGILQTTFQLNVKGNTLLQTLPILGTITSEQGTASK